MTLSICIPSYNYGHYLPEAIDSCLSQNADFKLIVLDNASTDNTPQLREKYSNDPRVRWFRNDSLIPVQENWNKVVSLAGSGWVKLLQADDRLLPSSINAISQHTRSHKEHAFIGHLSEFIDENSKIIRRQAPYSKSRSLIELRAGEGPSLKLQNIARLKEPTSNLFLKSAWEASGGWRLDLRFTFDIALNIELMRRYSGVLVSEYYAQVRRHSGSDGSSLPPDLAIGDLETVVYEVLSYSKDSVATKSGYSMLQYRTIELAAQKLRQNPAATFKFLYKHRSHLLRLSSFPITLSTIWRRLKTGDVQKTLA